MSRWFKGALLAPLLLSGAIALAPPAGATSLNVTFTVSSIDFGTTTIGTSPTEQIVISNSSAVPLYLVEAVRHGGAVGDFVTSPAGCAGTVAPAATCSIAVTFTPSEVGVRSSSVAVTMSAKDGLGHVVAQALVQAALTGRGVQPTMTLSDANAGTVQRGSSGAADALVTNTSSVPLSVDEWSLQGNVHHEFAVTALTCPTPLLPGASCDVIISFSPTFTGASSATLTLVMNVIGASGETIHAQSNLNGTGSTHSGLPPVVSVSNFNAGTVVVGTSATGEVVVLNTSTKDVLVNHFSVSGNAMHEFSVGTTTCTSALAPGATCLANVTFTPSVPLMRNSSLGVSVTTTRSGHAITLSVHSSLQGTGQRPTVALTAPNFGTVTVGSSTVNEVVVTNSSLAPLALKHTALSGPHLPSWSISSTTCTGALAPSASCEVQLTFAPHTAGDLSVQLNAVFSITVGHHTVTVPGQLVVNATGAQPTFSVVVPSFASTPRHVAVVVTAVVTNTSNVALAYSSVQIGGANPADFTVVSTTCTAQLAPSGSCNLIVRFDPLQSGSGVRTAVLVVNLSVLGIAPPHSVSLSTPLSAQES